VAKPKTFDLHGLYRIEPLGICAARRLKRAPKLLPMGRLFFAHSCWSHRPPKKMRLRGPEVSIWEALELALGGSRATRRRSTWCSRRVRRSITLDVGLSRRRQNRCSLQTSLSEVIRRLVFGLLRVLIDAQPEMMPRPTLCDRFGVERKLSPMRLRRP
jgi:hypothetical protein